MRITPAVQACVDSPIGAAKRLLAEHPDPGAVLDLSQAAPPYPPAPEVAEAAAAASRSSSAYTPVPGLMPLREAFAAELTRDCAGAVEPDDVMITAGCNQAFSLVASTIAAAGDEMILPLPAYFNHEMWLRLQGIRPVLLEPGPDLVPRAADAEALITPRTRAIVLITPNNPTGVTLPPAVIAEFAAVARRHDVALVIDETYRSFRDTTAPPHALFADPDWRGTVVGLHSFSKDLAIPGHRVGAIVAAPELIRQVLKLMDCVAICAPRVGQEAAWAGLTEAAAWRASRSREVADRRAAFAAAMEGNPFELLSTGAYFAWVRHPFETRSTDDVVRELLLAHHTLVIPGTAFLPDDRRTMRVSVAGVADPGAVAARFAALGAVVR